MARNRNVPFKGRIQKRKTYRLQIVTFGLQRAAGPYRRAKSYRGALTAWPLRVGLRAQLSCFKIASNISHGISIGLCKINVG